MGRTGPLDDRRAEFRFPRGRPRAQARDDPRFVADTLYLDIVPDRRIVFSYSMTSRDMPISVSLTTVELAADGGQHTRLLLTEQIAFLDDQDNAVNREDGLSSMLDKIGALFP